MEQHVLISTLGTQPQGVTWLLDWLLEQGYPIGEVVVIHTSGGAMDEAIRRLDAEFASGRYPNIRYRPYPLMGERGAIEDIASEADAWVLLRALYRALRMARQAGQTIHLNLTSGRKTMAVYAMVAAQLLFGENDRAWHMIVSAEGEARERAMHRAPGEAFQVVSVPVIRWSDAATASILLSSVDDPWEAIRRQREYANHEALRRRYEFWHYHLTRAQRQVAELLVREGLDNAAIARRLGKSEQTVANQLTRIYRAFEAWRGGVPSRGASSRAAFIAEFAPYLAAQDSKKLLNKPVT
jgi:CRISPR-associated protein Csx14